MTDTKWSYVIPSVATILAAIITAYVAYLGIQVKDRDLGSIDEGQKLCVVADTGTWHNITVVPQNWTVSMCKDLGNPFEAGAYTKLWMVNTQVHECSSSASSLANLKGTIV